MHCQNCGEEITDKDARFCPNCGAELEADAKFCMKCGQKVE